MAICKFYQQGHCKFGNSCRFEHINTGNRNQTPNRFAAFGGGAPQTLAEKYSITAETIERDLTAELPQWIFSAYAPGRDAPGQLFGGYPREQSFEELRLHYVMGKAAGNEQQALNQAQELFSDLQQQNQNAARNAQQGVDFIVNEENNHPNRHDICKQGTQGAPFGEFLVGRRPKSLVPDPALSNPFGSNTNTTSPFGGAPATTSAFGQPSALGQRPSPFGAPSFGQPSQPANALPFGQPSKTSAFGQPSQGASPFAQTSQPPSAFGQPSALGVKPSPFGTPAFGQPSQPSQPSQPNSQGSVFGQPSQPNPQGSAFGQPSQLGAQGSAFGQPSQLGQKPNPFGSMANNNSSASPFATVSNNAPANSNPFGGSSSNQSNAPSPFASSANNQTNNTPSPFGQPSRPTTSPFAQPSIAPAPVNPFATANQGQASGARNPFGSPQISAVASQNQQQTSTPFGQPSTTPFGQPAKPTAQQANAFAPAQQKPAQAGRTGNPYPPGSSKQHPPLQSYSVRGMDGRLVRFKEKPVTYKEDVPGIREFNGTWKRIWFPDGPPGYSKDTELLPEKYDERSKAQWEAFARTGNFEGGIMPELPPPRECTVWDF